MTTGHVRARGTADRTPVTLTKSAPAVSLSKNGAARGLLRVNLNWTALPAKQTGGRFRRLLRRDNAIDLDLGCLYEYADGSKGVVQALGDAFKDEHSYGANPIIWLDGDDRSGANSEGENLFIDLRRAEQVRRVLVFAYIYDGTPNWAAANGMVTLYPDTGREVVIHLDEPDPAAPMVAIALVENRGGDVVIDRQVRYIHGAQDTLDQAYGWGMRWTPGRK